jgi:hypothetical protein
MKNRNYLFILCLTFVAILPSCKKKVETCKLGKYYVSDGNTSPKPNVFSYYDDGRIQTITYADASMDTLSYSADTLWVTTYDYNDSLVGTFVGITNGAGDVVSGVKTIYDHITGSVVLTDNYSNEYNAEGNLTKQTISNGGGTTLLTLTYLNGNTVTGTLYNGAVVDKKYDFFHGSAANKTGIDDLDGLFTPYFGKPSANLLDSTHVISLGDTIRVQYAHTLDDNDYVSKTIVTSLNSANAQT